MPPPAGLHQHRFHPRGPHRHPRHPHGEENGPVPIPPVVPGQKPDSPDSWFTPYFTRQDAQASNQTPLFDVKCRHHHSGNPKDFCATAVKFAGGDEHDDASSYLQDEFGSLNTPSPTRNPDWFIDHNLQVIKVLEDENPTAILNEFKVEFDMLGVAIGSSEEEDDGQVEQFDDADYVEDDDEEGEIIENDEVDIDHEAEHPDLINKIQLLDLSPPESANETTNDTALVVPEFEKDENFTLEFDDADEEEHAIEINNGTEDTIVSSWAKFDNHFNFISVYPNRMEDYEETLNQALKFSLVDDEEDTKKVQNPFKREKIDYYDWNTTQFYEIEILRRNGSCKEIGEALMHEDEFFMIHFENHSFSLGSRELFREENGTCEFGISGFADKGLGDLAISIIGKPFLKKYDVAFQTVPEGIVLVYQKYDTIDENDEEDQDAEIEEEKSVKKIDNKPKRYSTLFEKLYSFNFSNFIKDHGLTSWYTSELSKFAIQSNEFAILSGMGWIFMVVFGTEFTALFIFTIYEVCQYWKRNILHKN